MNSFEVRNSMILHIYDSLVYTIWFYDRRSELKRTDLNRTFESYLSVYDKRSTLYKSEIWLISNVQLMVMNPQPTQFQRSC